MAGDAVLRHQNLVRTIVKTTFLPLIQLGCDFEDLVQEGLYAVMKAEPHYTPSRGKETTYYARCVRHWLSWRIGHNMSRLKNRANFKPLSLDAPVSDGASGTFDCTLMGLLEDQTANVEQTALNRISLTRAMNRLQVEYPRQAEAIRMRFWDEQTTTEIGKTLGCTRQRADQMIFSGIANLRRYINGREYPERRATTPWPRSTVQRAASAG